MNIKMHLSWMRIQGAVACAALVASVLMPMAAGAADYTAYTVFPNIHNIPGWKNVGLGLKQDPPVFTAKESVLWGDPNSGEHASIHEWGAGMRTYWHTRASDIRIVTIYSALIVWVDGGPSKEVTPGGFIFIPKGVKHRLRSNPMGKTAFVVYQNGPAGIQEAKPPQ